MLTNYKVSTPTSINSMDVDDILQYVGDDGDKNVASPVVRLRLTKMLYDVLGMTLTPDIALAMIAEPKATLVLSTAGGGKTTWAQIKAILEKIMRKSVYHPERKIRGDSVLCLVYNKHNVADMKDRHREMVLKLQAYGIKGLDIDTEIHASTLHSFCDYWRREFVADMELLGATLLEQAQAEAFMRRSINIACKQEKCEEKAASIDASNVLGVYTYFRETMKTDISELADCDKFTDLNISEDLLCAIFVRYDKAKKLQHKYDFVDMLYKFYCLLRDNEKARKRVCLYYEYVIADEVQDFTPLMWEILKLMVSDGTPLTCIGDEDQNIYAFRGADIYNTLQFSEMFDGGRIYSLEYNRRCSKRILDEARNIIEMNSLRYDKTLLGVRDGGSVTYEPYNSINGQFVNVLKKIRELPQNELNDTVICYRDTMSSTVLTDMLISEDVIFNVISGAGPFSHELYRHLFGIFDALEMPYDMNNCIQLYKVLPCTRDDYFKAIHYDAAKHKFTQENPRGIHFSKFDYGALGERKSFSDVLMVLENLSAQIPTRSVGELINPVFDLLNKYFWQFKMTHLNRFPEIDKIMQGRVLKYFQSPLVYSEFFQEYQTKKSRYLRYSESREGVTVSTFHSLKGLEFKNVIVVCMDDSIFPNFPLIDSRNYPDAIKQSLKEAEVRLWYVAVTRAKDNLIVYYSKSNPSVFVEFALQNSFPEHIGISSTNRTGESVANTDSKNVQVNSDVLLEELMVSDGLDDLGTVVDSQNESKSLGAKMNQCVADSEPCRITAFDGFDLDATKITMNVKPDTPTEPTEVVADAESAESVGVVTEPDIAEITQTKMIPEADNRTTEGDNGIMEANSESDVQLKSGKHIYLSRLLKSL